MGTYARFAAKLDRIIGYGVTSGNDSLEYLTKAVVVLKKTANNELKIVTSYPVNYDIEEAERLDEQYPALSCFLLYCLIDAYNSKQDIETITRYLQEEALEEAVENIAQLYPILDSSEFPLRWITNITNRSFNNDLDCKEWIRDMLEILVQESGIEVTFIE